MGKVWIQMVGATRGAPGAAGISAKLTAGDKMADTQLSALIKKLNIVFDYFRSDGVQFLGRHPNINAARNAGIGKDARRDRRVGTAFR